MPIPVRYGATRQTGQNLMLNVLLWGKDQVTCRRGRVFSPWKGSRGILIFQGFPNGRFDVSSFRRIHKATEPRNIGNVGGFFISQQFYFFSALSRIVCRRLHQQMHAWSGHTTLVFLSVGPQWLTPLAVNSNVYGKKPVTATYL